LRSILRFRHLLERHDLTKAIFVRSPMFGDASTSRDYTYITDIVDGVEKALAQLDENRRTPKRGVGR
jgi:nucleoside-diphosphate-sugar epimerase